MTTQNKGPRTLVGVGYSAHDDPGRQVRSALDAAREQTADLPPVTALVVSSTEEIAGQAFAGVKEVLPDCAVVACRARPCRLSGVFPRGSGEGGETGILLLASSKMDVKIGTGEGGASWEENLEKAFAESFIPPSAKTGFEGVTEQWLIDWYLYRRPSLVLAVIVSSPEDKASRRQTAEAFLNMKFRGRIPVMTCHLVADKAAGRLWVDQSVISDGIALVTIKTDLSHKVERFHNFEPIGKKYFVTKAEGRKVLELNNRPALPEYLRYMSDSISDAKSYLGYFSLYPLAYRGREGRYHLFIPEEIHDDLSITLPTDPLVELPLLPMISISSAQAATAGADGSSRGGGEDEVKSLEIILRNDGLRDCALPRFTTSLGGAGRQCLELHVGGDFSACLPEGDWEGETSHLAVRVESEIEPLAIVARENERLLKEVFSEKSKVEAMVDGLAETLYIVDGGYALQFYQDAGAGRARLSDTPEGRRCYEVVFQRELPCPWCALGETLSTRQVVRQTVHLREEGSHFQLTFSPWSDQVGQADYSICLMVDITAQKKMEEQMIKTKKLSSLSVLSAGMAHELNNPLGAINFNLEVLKSREGDAEYREIIDGIAGDVQRINRIIGNLLTFSRSGTKQGELLDIRQVVDSSLELVAAPLAKGRVSITADLPPGLPRIWGNLQDLQQVFVNLINNARDAMPAGGKIHIAARLTTPSAEDLERAVIVVVYEGQENVDLLRGLQHENDWEVVYLRAGEEALDYISVSQMEEPDALLLAISGSPAECGLDGLLSRVEEIFPRTKVISVTGTKGGGEQPPGAAEQSVAREELIGTLRSLQSDGRSAGSREFLEVRVEDDGIGIDPEKADRIFDPFFTTKDEKRGTGLGLSVVHKILENHGAEISVESAAGEGSVFAIRFPVTAEPDGPGREPYFKEKRSTWGKLLS